MKKLFLSFILIFSLSFFCGCNKTSSPQIRDNYIMLSLEQSSNGGMTQSIRFGVDSKSINKMASSLKEEITFRRNLIEEVNEIRNEFLFSYAILYVKNPVEEYKINQGVILTDVCYNEKGDYVGFEMIFTSSGAWNYYHPSSSSNDKEESKPKRGGNIFFTKSSSHGLFPFSAKINTGEEKLVGNVYKDRYLSSADGLSFESKLKDSYQPQFIYNYATYSQRLKTNGNLSYHGTDNKYHHVWIVDGDKLTSENQIEISLTIINKGWWLFFAVGIPLSACGISIFIVKFKQKRKIKK